MYYQASVTGFVKTILIILIVYYALKFLVRLVLPFAIKNYADQMAQQYHNPKKEGEISINYVNKAPKNNPLETGEYVHYEEVQ